MEREIALEMRGVSKYFGSVVANKNVNLKVYKGEILAVLGENGSGKTTLMNMISGIYFPDEGQTFVGGEEAVIRSPQDAFAYKIGMIHQHFKLVDVFTAAQNIVLGVKNEPKPVDDKKNAFLKFFAKIGRKMESGLYKKKEVAAQVKVIADKYGFEIDPNKKIYNMSVSEKQTVEIVKVLYRGANVLILDEPTAVLTPQETEKLFAVLRKMKEDGKSIIIITHKLNEVLAVSDRVAILRKGESVGEIATKDADENKLTELMVGKKVALNIERSTPENCEDRLEIKGLNVKSHDGVKVLDNVSFTAKSGEILGIAGIAGSGQKELLEAIAGLQKLESGDMIFHNPKKDKPVTFFHKDLHRVKELAKEGAFRYENGETVDFTGKTDKEIKELVNAGKVLFKEDEIIDLKDKTPLQIRELGIRLSFVPEDRLGMGLVGNMDIVDNMMLRSYRKGNSVFLDRSKPGKLADEIIEELEVVTPSAHTPVRRLSGGNVQKVLVGREIASAPKVLMAAYPVRGLDINSSYTIYNLLNKQKENGAAVIFVGEDLDVLIELCDRILVIGSGKVTGIVDGRTANKSEIGLLMVKTESAGNGDGVKEAVND
ncbi:MAG: ABC transporter ATP-binding protein [Firmicutes bacterium]|nr:ABC transporter ATP-binding protein [Bacillota bacterium]